MAPPVFKTGLAGNTLAGRFDSFPPPPSLVVAEIDRFEPQRGGKAAVDREIQPAFE